MWVTRTIPGHLPALLLQLNAVPSGGIMAVAGIIFFRKGWIFNASPLNQLVGTNEQHRRRTTSFRLHWDRVMRIYWRIFSYLSWLTNLTPISNNITLFLLTAISAPSIACLVVSFAVMKEKARREKRARLILIR